MSTADVKPFHVRPVHLRHSIGDEFAQYAWGLNSRLSETSDVTPKYQPLVDCHQSVSPTGKLQWWFRGVTASGGESEWVSETEMLQTFTPLQLDGFIAL